MLICTDQMLPTSTGDRYSVWVKGVAQQVSTRLRLKQVQISPLTHAGSVITSISYKSENPVSFISEK